MIKLIPNELFDDGSIECYNFWLNTTEGTEQVSLKLLEILGLKELVRTSIQNGKKYTKVHNLIIGGIEVLEVTWG